MSRSDAYAAERRRRVLSRFARRLGSRFAVVGEPARMPPSMLPLVVCAPEGGDVVAHETAVPVASGALTGVVLVCALDGTASPALAERRALRMRVPQTA